MQNGHEARCDETERCADISKKTKVNALGNVYLNRAF